MTSFAMLGFLYVWDAGHLAYRVYRGREDPAAFIRFICPDWVFIDGAPVPDEHCGGN